MKRYEISAYIGHQGSIAGKAIATTKETPNGRFVRYTDVEALVEKAEYWEEEFRREFRRVSKLCDLRHKTRNALKKIQEDLL